MRVTPDGYLQMKALMGDPSGQHSGVPSIGKKTAAKIIQEYQSVENAIAHAAQVESQPVRDRIWRISGEARLSLTLATICTDCDIPEDVSPFSMDNFQNPAFIQVLKQYEFKSLLERFYKSGMAEQMSLMEEQGLETRSWRKSVKTCTAFSLVRVESAVRNWSKRLSWPWRFWKRERHSGDQSVF
ncbi:MAG: 5'-3' exonuclease H3TH domain-containing protein [Bianqueaceae bacterium]